MDQQDRGFGEFWYAIKSSSDESEDKLYDISKEYQMLQRTKDIQDELQMVAKVVSEQMAVLNKLQDLSRPPSSGSRIDEWETLKLTSSVRSRLDLLGRLQAQAHSTYQSVSRPIGSVAWADHIIKCATDPRPFECQATPSKHF